jgi:hypothetical protein
VFTAQGTVAPVGDSGVSVAELEQDPPMAAAPTEVVIAGVATTAIALDVAAAAPAAAAELPVLRDVDELRAFAESRAVTPPPLNDVVAGCEANSRSSRPDAVFADADGVATDVIVASTADGYAAVSLDDCTIVVRTPSGGDEAEG